LQSELAEAKRYGLEKCEETNRQQVEAQRWRNKAEARQPAQGGLPGVGETIEVRVAFDSDMWEPRNVDGIDKSRARVWCCNKNEVYWLCDEGKTWRRVQQPQPAVAPPPGEAKCPGGHDCEGKCVPPIIIDPVVTGLPHLCPKCSARVPPAQTSQVCSSCGHSLVYPYSTQRGVREAIIHPPAPVKLQRLETCVSWSRMAIHAKTCSDEVRWIKREYALEAAGLDLAHAQKQDRERITELERRLSSVRLSGQNAVDRVRIEELEGMVEQLRESVDRLVRERDEANRTAENYRRQMLKPTFGGYANAQAARELARVRELVAMGYIAGWQVDGHNAHETDELKELRKLLGIG
jgi:hypothetical protein